MDVALDYGREKAPPDVADSLDWLLGEGFADVAERGGPGESFGNLFVHLRRPGMAVRGTRDRGQWSVELAPAGGEFVPLNVLLTARDGSAPVVTGFELRGPVAEVLPPGVEWRVALPGIISWLESGDRAREIGEARARWRQAMKRWVVSVRGFDGHGLWEK
jgi:hypothetical protein